MERKETRLIRSKECRSSRQASPNFPQVTAEFVASEPQAVSFHPPPSPYHINPVKEPKTEIVPMDLHHPILREFPEHREVIRRLKGSNAHFRSVFDEYHRLDDEIYRIEEDIDFAIDQEIEELKMRRAKLKDYIYHLIRHAPVSVPVPTPVYETAAAVAQAAA
jgi:uncharacterized protein YdcH (DUF465 family)